MQTHTDKFYNKNHHKDNPDQGKITEKFDGIHPWTDQAHLDLKVSHQR